MGGSWFLTWCSLVDLSPECYFPVITLDCNTEDVGARDGGVVGHRSVIC